MSGRARSFLLLAIGIVVIALVGGAAGYLTKKNPKPEFEPFVAALESTGTRGVVQSIDGDTLTILTNSESLSFTLTSDTIVERIRPIDTSLVSVGDWLNAGAIPHDQTTLTIVGLTVIPETLLRE